MKKVLIFGSSHIGAIKNGLELFRKSNTSRFDYSFLGLSSRKFRRVFNIQHGLIYSRKRNIRRTIKQLFGCNKLVHLTSFDAIVYLDGPCLLDLSLYSNTGSIAPLSREVAKSIIYHGDLGCYFRSLQTAYPANQLYYLGAPLKSQDAVNIARYNEHTPTEFMMSNKHMMSALQAAVREVCDSSLIDDSQPNYLVPPQVLLDQTGFLTRREFMSEGARFDGRTRELNDPDVSHGNAEYGKIIIDHLETILK
jgi:hypothetical protein